MLNFDTHHKVSGEVLAWRGTVANILLLSGYNWLKDETWFTSNDIAYKPTREYHMNFERQLCILQFWRVLAYITSKLEKVGQFVKVSSFFPSSPSRTLDDKKWLHCQKIL